MGPTQTFGEHGEPCGQCGAPLATDQRYCLNCGTRRADSRLDTDRYLSPAGPVEAERVTTAESRDTMVATEEGPPRRDWTAVYGIGALMALGIMFVIGVLIGKEDAPVTTAQQPVIRLGGATAGPANTGGESTGPTAVETANTAFKSDWPDGKEGWTVELGSLPKQGSSGADVEAAKADSKEKGAKDVGALDSDQYGSLPGGNYVVYSGVFDTKADASKALDKLKGDFPDAQVIKVAAGAGGGGGGPAGGGGAGGGGTTVSVPNTDPVDSLTSPEARNSDEPVTASDAALEALENSTGDDYQEQVKNLPETIAIPGEAPPEDNVAPGGGSGGGITIGGR